MLQRFLPLLDVLAEQLDLVDPRRLARELGEVHRAVRAVIVAYDPMIIAADLDETITPSPPRCGPSMRPRCSATPRSCNRSSTASSRRRRCVLSDVAHELDDVGARLAAIDLNGLVTSVNHLGPQLDAAFDASVEAIKKEILELLEALRFAAGGASASVSVGVSASAGGGG